MQHPERVAAIKDTGQCGIGREKVMDHAGYLILRNVTRLVIRRQQLSTVTMSRKVEEELERLLRVLFSFFSFYHHIWIITGQGHLQRCGKSFDKDV